VYSGEKVLFGKHLSWRNGNISHCFSSPAFLVTNIIFKIL